MSAEKTRLYEETITYLYQLRRLGTKFGLENIQGLSQLLGNPHVHYRSIHIAGTNGKGSTASILASILKQSGLKVGLFTSPHLSSFTERVSIDGIAISEAEVVELAAFIRNSIAKYNSSLNPTFFEFVTALAFYYFSLHRVDYGIFETGMGGRLDATNILRPIVSVITNISMDHMACLGTTIEAIAFEKAGIIKTDTDVVTGITGVGLSVIEDVAQSKNAPLHIYRRDFFVTVKDSKKGLFQYKGFATYEDLYIPLNGKHQVDNAALGIRVCEILEKRGLLPDGAQIRSGLKETKMIGRIEVISQSPLIVLDGAHNPEAIKAVIATVRSLFPDKKIILVAGMMEDKDIKGTMEPMLQIVKTLILTKPEGQRAAQPETIARLINVSLSDEIKITHSVAEALKMAFSLQNEDTLVLVTGSFYVAGEARTILKGNGTLAELRE